MFRFQVDQHVKLTTGPYRGSEAVVINADAGDGYVRVRFVDLPIEVDVVSTALMPIPGAETS